MSTIKRKIKLTNLLNWVYDVFGVGMNDEHRKVWFENKKIINSTMNVTREFYHAWKLNLLSLAVAVEYRDYEDKTGDRKTKLYTCYKNKGRIWNDLSKWMSYIVIFYYNNTHVPQIDEMRQKINQETKTILRYKKYFELKYKLIQLVSYGMTNEYGSFEENYKIIVQGYEQGENYVKTTLQKLKENKQNKRTKNGIMNGILS